MSKNKVLYLTERGAQCLFGNPKVVGLAVVPTEGPSVYEKVYDADDGTYIGGFVSSNAFTDTRPGDASLAYARAAFESHRRDLEKKFGPRKTDRDVDVKTLLE